MSAPAAYFLLSLATALTGADGAVTTTVETFDTRYATLQQCEEAEKELEPVRLTKPPVVETYQCDPGGPDIPTAMELAAGE